ncbi:MAG: NAD(+)/NADH kinase [Phycisphaerae bacterium]
MTSSKPQARIFLIGNASKPSVVEVFKRLTDWLASEELLAGADLNGTPEAVRESGADHVIALGGDGTILHAAQVMGHHQIPIIGVNLGKLGYLADFDESEIRAGLSELLFNPKWISRRMMLDVRIATPDDQTWRDIAVNDCVIRVGDPFRTVSTEICINGHPLCTLHGDGVIVATPTGSTAHNMSCGGPIVEPGVDAVILTPKCAHSFTHRPIVVTADSELRIRVLPESHGAAAVLDGQRIRLVSSETYIYVKKSAASFQLVRNPKRRPWDTLIMKLKWGQDIT